MTVSVDIESVRFDGLGDSRGETVGEFESLTDLLLVGVTIDGVNAFLWVNDWLLQAVSRGELACICLFKGMLGKDSTDCMTGPSRLLVEITTDECV